MIDDILVFDNIIDSKSQKKFIQDIVFKNIKWTFISDVTKPDNKQQRPGFLSFHNYMKEK